ncbi:MAG: hypothetical protein IMF18_07275 [Proteobacteria bacterium]|nr:hypothetical protein [Pseudomonadota bacterium]
MKKFAVILLALGLVAAFTLPAMAEGITPYASVRLGTFWANHDYDRNSYAPGWTTDSDDGGFVMDLDDISRFGAKGTVGDIYGQVEIGLVGVENQHEYTSKITANGSNGVYTRLLFGRWDFGSGTLTVGQDYTPTTYISGQQGPGIFDDLNTQSYDLQNAFIGVGCLWDSRRPQIRVNLDNGFYFGIVKPQDATAPQGWVAGSMAETPPDADVDITLPKMLIGFDYKTEGLYISPGFTYNTYTFNDKAAGGTFDDDISSWILFVKSKVDFGAAVLKVAVHYGENLGDYGISGRKNPYSPLAPGTANRFDPSRAYVKQDGTTVEDAECWGGYLDVAIPVDPYTIGLGVGYSSSKNDGFKELNTPARTFDNEDDLMGYYVNCKIPITDNFSATPEFDYWDGMKNVENKDDPDHWYLGITWQMDF